eukprot:TRINITY_DN18760_c0_g1_i1.p1 TRINITY_DN18760_c0_g1~~TRINITY_DN18760_c0_g1_i1.p1  ORF type:complete len:261 (+),score=60.37 TRINITY_DN18760_c0_g1_i1:28-783(+)
MEAEGSNSAGPGGDLPSYALKVVPASRGGGGLFFLRNPKRDGQELGRGGGFNDRQTASDLKVDYNSDDEQIDEFGRKKRRKTAASSKGGAKVDCKKLAGKEDAKSSAGKAQETKSTASGSSSRRPAAAPEASLDDMIHMAAAACGSCSGFAGSSGSAFGCGGCSGPGRPSGYEVPFGQVPAAFRHGGCAESQVKIPTIVPAAFRNGAAACPAPAMFAAASPAKGMGKHFESHEGGKAAALASMMGWGQAGW